METVDKEKSTSDRAKTFVDDRIFIDVNPDLIEHMKTCTIMDYRKNITLPTKEISELQKGREYLVTCLTQIHSEKGWKAVLEIEHSFDLILPDWISKIIEKDEPVFHNLAENEQMFVKYVNDEHVEIIIR